MNNFLRRYTELPFAIEYLKSKELTLLSPATWDDKNDSFYLEQYRTKVQHESVFALCLTESSETYHHWKIFSNGSGGVCIEFKKDALMSYASKVEGLRAEPVQYQTIEEIRNSPPELEALPFLKRKAFRDELEFRLFFSSDKTGADLVRIPVPISAVDHLVLSPWLPKSVADSVKKTLKAIPGAKSLKVYRSTLVDNVQWKKGATR
jgi:hypothetical protein